MEGISHSPAAWGYLLTCLGYGYFVLKLAVSGQQNPRTKLMSAALLSSVVWAALGCVDTLTGNAVARFVATTFDSLRLLFWYVLLLSLIQDPLGNTLKTVLKGVSSTPTTVISLGILALANIVTMGLPVWVFFVGGINPQLKFVPPLALAIIGLILVEQVLRHASVSSRWSLKPLALGLGASFCFDLYLFAEAFLLGQVSSDVEGMRGLVNLITIPLLHVATNRTKGWSARLTISHHIIFRSTALLASGLYLLAIAGVGYYLRTFGGYWGGGIQAIFFFSALLLLAVLVFSDTFRSKLRVYISKNFFSYRYDYREEWLRFTQSLSAPSLENQSLPEIVIHSLAQLVESPAGALWLADDEGHMRQHSTVDFPRVSETEPQNSSLLEFLSRSHWIVDVDAWRAEAREYEGLTRPAWLDEIPNAWLIIPLFFEQKIFGLVVLGHSRAEIELNWEVLDLLKTAASQASSYLTHMRAADALLEAKKFDSFNRMSAFVVHDIKNLVAQLSLLLRNAEKHKDNPEFQEDMFLTIAHVVERMKHLLLQLRAGTTPIERAMPVALEPILNRLMATRRNSSPQIALAIQMGIDVLGHAERLERVINHLLQNALDATPASGKVWLSLFKDDQHAVVEIGDTGVGMSQDFVRNRLFRPFDSTKSAGMGIGAYESSQYISELKGHLTVESEPGKGTVMQIRLPLYVRNVIDE